MLHNKITKFTGTAENVYYKEQNWSTVCVGYEVLILFANGHFIQLSSNYNPACMHVWVMCLLGAWYLVSETFRASSRPLERYCHYFMKFRWFLYQLKALLVFSAVVPSNQ